MLSGMPKHKLMPEANARFQKLSEQQREYHESMQGSTTWFPTYLASNIPCKYCTVLLIVTWKLEAALQAMTVLAQTQQKTTLYLHCSSIR